MTVKMSSFSGSIELTAWNEIQAKYSVVAFLWANLQRRARATCLDVHRGQCHLDPTRQASYANNLRLFLLLPLKRYTRP
jgi:hypothetical protein